MKRFILLAVLALACLASTSEAQRMGDPQEIKWIRRSASASASTFAKSTTTLGGGKSDTTGTFDLDGCYMWTGSADSDSLPMAYLIIESDSAVAFSANITNITVTIDAVSTNSASRTGVIAITVPITAGDLFARVPLWWNSEELFGLKALHNPFMWNKMRARITIAAGTSTFPQARVYLRKILGPS